MARIEEARRRAESLVPVLSLLLRGDRSPDARGSGRLESRLGRNEQSPVHRTNLSEWTSGPSLDRNELDRGNRPRGPMCPGRGRSAGCPAVHVGLSVPAREGRPQPARIFPRALRLRGGSLGPFGDRLSGFGGSDAGDRRSRSSRHSLAPDVWTGRASLGHDGGAPAAHRRNPFHRTNGRSPGGQGREREGDRAPALALHQERGRPGRPSGRDDPRGRAPGRQETGNRYSGLAAPGASRGSPAPRREGGRIAAGTGSGAFG